MGKLNQTAAQVQELLDKVSAAQNAEKSATDLALMQDVKRQPFSAIGDFFLSTVDDSTVAILGIKNQIDFNKVATGDTLFIAESSGEFQLYLSVLSSAVRLGSSYQVSGQVMGTLMTQDGSKIVAGRFNAVRPLSSTEFTSVSVTLFTSADNESGSSPKHHEAAFMQTGDNGEFVCDTGEYPVFENIKVGDIVSIDAQDPGNNHLMTIIGTVTNADGNIELRNVLMCSDKGTTSIPYFYITQESPTKCYFYPTDFPTFTPTQRVWRFMFSGMDMEGNSVLEIPVDFIDSAVAGDMVLVDGCRGVVINDIIQPAGLNVASQTKYMMVFTASAINYYKVTQDEVTLVSTIPYQQENANAQRVWSFAYAGDNNGYAIPDGWAENAKVGDCVVVHEEYVGFITWLAEDKAGGRLITFDSSLNVRYITFKKGILMVDGPIQISSLDSRLKVLEQSSVTLTRAEYDALATKNPNTTYYITDDGGMLQ